MEENIIVIRGPKNFCFNFDFSKDVNENLKCEFVFIIKSNESVAKSKLKNKMEQLLLKCNEPQDEWTTLICS